MVASPFTTQPVIPSGIGRRQVFSLVKGIDRTDDDTGGDVALALRGDREISQRF
jgi:hypothetical protein